jgi:hypothetical protein
MNWYYVVLKYAAQAMPLNKALQIMGLTAPPQTVEELRKHRNNLLKNLRIHPDQNQNQNSANKMVDLNNAYEAIEHAIEMGGRLPPRGGTNYSDEYAWAKARPEYREDPRYAEEETPEWQTDERSRNNNLDNGPVPQAWHNLNRCKVDIYEKAMENGGGVTPMRIVAFDGHYFRGSFTVKCNDATLPFAGEVMEYWNSKGTNPYPTAAVFVDQRNQLKCIRLWGTPVNDFVPINWEFDEDIPHVRSPMNSNRYLEQLRKWVEDQR